MKTTIDTAPRILVVDDNTAIHEDFRKTLLGVSTKASALADLEAELFSKPAAAKVGPFRVDFASQGQEALALAEAALKANDPYALAFVDIRMPPGWDGVETIERIWKLCPDLQAVMCTAYSDYSWHEIIGRFGHVDNLLILKKPFETVEVLQLAHALTRKWLLGRQAHLRMDELERMAEERAKQLLHEAEERSRAQSALLVSEERFTKAFQSSPMPMAIQSQPEGRFLAVNASFLELVGHSAEKILQHTSDELNVWKDAGVLKVRLQPDGRLRNYSCVLQRQGGEERNIVLYTEPLTADAQPCLLIVAEDVTERLKLEAGLRQAQKLEAVGRLVAGVAHEFNNVLGVIQGHASMLQSELSKEKQSTACTERILQASKRAANFTRQLLGMTRQQAVHLKAVSLPMCVKQAQEMLGQSLGENHKLKMSFADDLPPVRADECNIEQVLINLVLNARDAMTDGGDILIDAQTAKLPESYAQEHGAKAGAFVCLTVSDRGKGISPEIAEHIFDPFFTTKEVGKGTGLGLWMVQNIIRRHGGWVELDSEAGRGSSFKIFLPVWDGPKNTSQLDEEETTARFATNENGAPINDRNGKNIAEFHNGSHRSSSSNRNGANGNGHRHGASGRKDGANGRKNSSNSGNNHSETIGAV